MNFKEYMLQESSLNEAQNVTFYFFYNDGKQKIVRDKKEAVALIGDKERLEKIIKDAKDYWKRNREENEYPITNGRLVVSFK